MNYPFKCSQTTCWEAMMKINGPWIPTVGIRLSRQKQKYNKNSVCNGTKNIRKKSCAKSS